jgi:hypothetical protein
MGAVELYSYSYFSILSLFAFFVIYESSILSGSPPKIKLTGLTFDTVWDNIIAQVGGIQIEGDRTTDEQLALDTERAELKR